MGMTAQHHDTPPVTVMAHSTLENERRVDPPPTLEHRRAERPGPQLGEPQLHIPSPADQWIA